MGIGIFYPVVSGDDGYCSSPEFTSNSSIIMGCDCSINACRRHSWILFKNVTIPSGALITNAYIRLTANNNYSVNTCKTDIYFSAVDNAIAPVNWTQYYTGVNTTATVLWTHGSWVSGVTYDSPDIKTLVQEVSSRSGFASGNSMMVYLRDVTHSSWYANRQAYSIDTGTPPALHVTFVSSPDPQSTSGVINGIIKLHPGERLIDGVSIHGENTHWWGFNETLAAKCGGIIGTVTYAGTNRTYVHPTTGVITAIGANLPRFEEVGGHRALLIEPAGTNYFLNSDAPVTQTTGSLGTGSYTVWIDGAGTATVAANTATITGAGAASDGSPVTFVVTGAGTVDITIAGGPPDRCQVENGVIKTSYITTAGAAVTRATESGEPSMANPPSIFANEGTIIAWVRPAFAHGDVSAGDYGIVACDDAAKSLLYFDENGMICSYDGAREATSGAINWSAGTWIKAVVQWGDSIFKVGYDSGSGITWGTPQAFDGAYAVTGGNLRFGYGLFSRQHIRNVMAFNVVLNDTEINKMTGSS